MYMGRTNDLRLIKNSRKRDLIWKKEVYIYALPPLGILRI